MTTTALLDSDIAAYLFASLSQSTYNFGDTGVCQHVQDFSEVTPKVDQWIEKLMERVKADALVVCLSVPTAEGFRIKILPSYKGNRVSVQKPVLLQQVKDYLASSFPSYIRPELEADDVMGILSTHPTLIKGTKVIVSSDKDMQTIPGLLFNPDKHKKPVRISEEQANRYHMYQTLIGDTVDGYKGCPGVGPVKANAYLDTHSSSGWWMGIVDMYESKGLTEEDALVQARVARICRWTDYDYSNKRVKLWTPR